MFSTISYIAPDGVETITFNDDSGYLIQAGGLSGLSGNSEDVALPLPWGGQRFITMNPKPMEATLKIIVEGDGKNEEAQQRVKRLRSMFSRLRPGTLTLDNGDGLIYAINLRQSGDIQVPEVETTLDDLIIIEIPVVSDDGYWRTTTSAAELPPASVSIHGEEFMARRFSFTNNTELPTSAKVVWSGNATGSKLLMFSGNTMEAIGSVTLPAAGDEKLVLDLSPRASLMVTDTQGQQKLDVWSQIKGTMFPVGVQPAQKQVIATNHPTAQVIYEMKTLDPWEW